MEGNIVVDWVLASCYPSGDHDLAHMIMMPIRYYPEIVEWIFGVEDGFPGFISIAESIGNYVAPYHSLY